MLERFISQLSKELELDKELEASAPGVFVLPMDEEGSIEITSQPEGFYLRCTPADCPRAKLEEFFTDMMLANLFYKGTMGATLGLNEEANKIILIRLIERESNYGEFHDALEDFMNSVDFWRKEALNYN